MNMCKTVREVNVVDCDCFRYNLNIYLAELRCELLFYNLIIITRLRWIVNRT